jgi:hypothetical protein
MMSGSTNNRKMRRAIMDTAVLFGTVGFILGIAMGWLR